METKDFLFFNYSWVKNSTFIFNKFKEKGHSIDIVDEKTIRDFIPKCKYKNVVLYLHENWTIPITNFLLENFLQDSFLIQHDDTDFEQIQKWSNREPNLFMQRELTKNTIINTNSPAYPFHFPIESIYEEKYQKKDIDISFIGTMTHYRRLPFVNHIKSLSQTSLKNLNWYIDVKPVDTRTPELFKEMTNRSKISLHYFGNSYDSIRIWEIISAKTALIMPNMRNLSVSDSYMPFKEYITIKDDFSDLEEKINYLLEMDRYKTIAEEGYNSYNNFHNPDKCFEYYYSVVTKYCKL
jgi:hypothetical protein